MKLDRLQLLNFRTYAELNREFENRLTFITGPNAAGKTNVIEAISVLSMGKSFRGASDQDMIREGENHYFLSAKFRRAEQSFKLELGCEAAAGGLRRKIKLNSKALSGRSQLIGNLITVVFSPADIQIVEGGPGARRRFLDMVLSSYDRDYLKNLIHYNRVLKQRNAVLKRMKRGQAKSADLAVWNPGLRDYAERITRARRGFIERFQEIFRASLKRISAGLDEIQLRLIPGSEREFEDFAGALEARERRDVAVGFTTIGPHRHNLLFERAGGIDVQHRGSQGQKRSLVLSLRIAQFYHLKATLGLSPVLLIDDVIRELDARRRAAFVQLLRECGQALFTTPDLDGLEEFIAEIGSDAGILRVENGALLPV